MKRIFFTLVVIGLFTAFGSESFAQNTPGADKRQKNQKQRVKQGARSGELTKREAKSIHKNTKSAKKYEAKAKSDGKVTWKERARLQHKENKSSRKIYRTKHNNRSRP